MYWLSVYVVACCTWCVFALWLRWSSLRALRHDRWIAPSSSVISAPPPQTLRSAWTAIVARPWMVFHRKVDRLWAVGYACYHVAIALVIVGYAASLGVLLHALWIGRTIPHYYSGSLAGNPTIANLMIWVFGNTEAQASQFLFGYFAPAFRAIAWCELPLALFGNFCLLIVAARSRVGAIRRGNDAFSRDVRYAGQFSGQHLLVRMFILTIITLEFVGRLDGFKMAAVWHTVVAFTFIALVPMTYLRHIPLAPFVMWQALSRRRLNRSA